VGSRSLRSVTCSCSAFWSLTEHRSSLFQKPRLPHFQNLAQRFILSKDAINTGIDSIGHSNLIDHEGIALAKQHGTYLDFDICNDDFILQEGAKAGMLPESIEKEKKIGRPQRENFRRAFQAGTKMAFATDAGFIHTAIMPSSSGRWWSRE
jgi:hypothetical protein